MFSYTNYMVNPKYKTTPREKMIINLMEEVINILQNCDSLDDPAFSMYYTMKDAVMREAVYPLEK